MVNKTSSLTLPIGAVERDTGISKDTLRVWERRYGFPQPGRDTNGDRVYPADQVVRLRHIKRLLDKGHRPGKLLALSAAELSALAERTYDEQVPWSRGAPKEELLAYLELCRLHRVEALRGVLLQTMVRLGLRDFVLDIVAPLTTAVGECWERGSFQVYEEHLFTEVVQNVLRGGIAGIRPPGEQARPGILLTTFPQERHTLGLQMAEAIFTLEGARCVSLGAETPIDEIVQAAAGMDVVALSFSIASNPAHMVRGLDQLAAGLDPSCRIWAGGAGTARTHCRLPSYSRVELDTAAAAIAAWRTRDA